MKILRAGALVVGTGCAGYCAADWLCTYGVRDVCLVTEGREKGTSRNAGSDKQTYYKLSLAAGSADSPRQMARDLFAGGGVHGDTALCEAAGSARAFLKLNLLGVPFPTNRYGEFVGYRTDNDPRMRATSVGPLTSRAMTEALERSALQKGARLHDRMQVVRLVVAQGRVHGLLALDLDHLEDEDRGLTLFLSPFVVWCTGGPALVYERTVYPPSQTGATGVALLAGAEGCNLNHWQYGLASTAFRWNLSGSYQQVLPRYVSVDAQGVEREFLPETLGGAARALEMVFRKGYEWPFDSARAAASSQVDLAVYRETVELGRRAYLDYTREPAGFSPEALGAEAREYLERSRALVPTPVERLRRMNPQALALYRSHGIDLAREKLEIAVCAQHHNGGLAVDADWQTTISGLYAAGEAAGTFGASRPGGSALNSGQVGAQRAAEHIAFRAGAREPDAAFGRAEAARFLEELQARIDPSAPAPAQILGQTRQEMTRCAAHLRDEAGMAALEARIAALPPVRARRAQELPAALRAQEVLAAQAAVLSAMRLSAARSGSLGSALVRGKAAGDPLPGCVLRTRREGTGFASDYGPVRPLPEGEDWFETVWHEYNAVHHIEEEESP
ncbi:MAG: FAD-binding protein [Candidatus Spyradocola sp.]|jgi:succinate dehydrogenase/fumarate reductase flavoprotein subunit